VHFNERTLIQAARAGITVAAGGGIALLAGAALSTPLPVAFGVGALLGLGAEGWRRTFALQRAQEDDKVRVRALLERADQRYLDLWTESEELRRLTLDNRNIATYLPKELVDRLRGTQQAPRLGGTKREVTVLFTDLRSYSTISEHLDPDDVIRLLNDCFGALVADAQAHGGTVLEFLGDGMLAVFGAPGHQPDHPVQAVRCAQAMVRSLERLNDTWALTGRDRLWTERGIAEVGFRAGIHTGTVVAGNLGTERLMKYTIVGDAVNLAARLEQLNKELGTTVAVSAETRALLPPELQAWLEPMGDHVVKGRAQPVSVFTHEPAPHG
jgi:class 3 adenylate cyclase